MGLVRRAIRRLAGTGLDRRVGQEARRHPTGHGTDVLASIERVLGSGFADTIAGNAAANLLRGRAGRDVLKGLGGKDALYGDAGNDSLGGGPGTDTCAGGTGTDTQTSCEHRTSIP